jgi:hypothetical protein
MGLKKSLAEEQSKFTINKLKAVAELKKSNADVKDIEEVEANFDRAISLRRLINQYSLEAANQGILDGNELAEYVTSKLGPDLTKEAVDIENTLFRDVEAIKSKAAVANGQYIV